MKLKIQTHLSKAQELLKERQYKESLALLQQIEVEPLKETDLGIYCLTKGEVLLFLGDYSHDYLDKAIDIFKKSSEDRYFAHAKYLKGWQLLSIGDPRKAKEPLIESYAAFLRIDDYDSAARALNRLAKIAFQTGDFTSATESLSKSISFYDLAGNTLWSNAMSMNLAAVHYVNGGFAEARKTYAGLEKQIHSFGGREKCVFRLGYAIATALSGDISKAKKMLAETAPMLEGFERVKANYYEYLGWISILDKDYNAAEKALAKGLKISLEIAPESALISQIKRLYGDLYIAAGKIDKAEKYTREALQVAEGINQRAEIAACYRVFAQVEQHRGNKNKAVQWYKKAVELFGLISSRYELAVTRYLAAVSGLFGNGERTAMLYLAKEYFESENLKHYIEKVDHELNKPHQSAKAESKKSPDADNGCPKIITVNPVMKKILSLAEHVARSEMSVLLTGPTGTGKDLMAAYIHHHSGRTGKFVIINAAAIPNAMVESELFGYSKGAFTGADKDKAGLFEAADGGTFYLNEVADTTPEFQAKLLEVLESRQVRRLGENKRRQVAFRLIAATNHDLNLRMRDGLFRCDLYHRLNEIPINLPPLDSRADDIPALVKYFLADYGLETKNGDDHLERLSLILAQQSWPGNIRELMAQVRFLYLTGRGDFEHMIDLALGNGSRTERDRLAVVLEMTEWNRVKTASILGVSEGTIRNWIKKHDLD